MRDEQLERAQWLNLARRQAREISAEREEQPPPFHWPAADEAKQRYAPQLLGMPLAWGVAAVTLVLLCGATGTYAYVRHLRQAQIQPSLAPAAAPVLEKAPVATPAPPRRTVQSVAPAADTAGPTQVAARPKKRRRSPRASAPAPAPAATPASTPSMGEVTFSPEEMPGGGELILVSPPPKMGPLWSPEEYRKSGRLGSKP